MDDEIKNGILALESNDIPTAQPAPKKPKSVLIGVIVAVAIVAIGVILTIVIIQSNTKNENSETNNTITDTGKTEDGNKKVVNADTAVRNLISDLNEAGTSFLQKNQSSETLEQIYDSSFPVFEPESANVPIALQKSYGLKTSTKIDVALAYNLAQEIDKVLADKDFKKYTVVSLMGETEQLYNSETEIICIADKASVPYQISCGSTTWISAEAIALASSLAEAYKQVEGEYPVFVSASKSDIQNSPFEPYQKLITTVGNFAGLFYRSSPNAEWVYFAGTQAVLPCSKYEKDTGAKRAFQGDACYDEETKETRKVIGG